MRINLVTPFAEKDAVKALGARWDGARKVWYVLNVADLTPFLKWIPDVSAATESQSTTAPGPAKAGVVTHAVTTGESCGCKALPWDDCVHTLKN